MKKIVLTLTVIVALCLAVWALAWGIALATGAVLFSRTLDSLAELVSMPGCVKSIMFWTFLIPFSVLAGRTLAPFRTVRMRGIVFLVSVFGVYWTITWVVNQQQFFDPKTGHPLKWVDVEPDGHATFFARAGVNPRTGHTLVPVTPELLQKVTVPQGAPVSPQPVDPERTDWFSPVTGAPLLCYVGSETNATWEFFTGAPGMFDPRTGKALEPVTQDVRTAWEADMRAQREAAEKARLAAEEAERKAKQQAEEQQRLAKARQREAEEKEATQQVEQQAEQQRRLAETQRREQEQLAEQRQQVAAEAAEVARRTKEQADEQQRFAEAQRLALETLAAARQQEAAEKVRLKAEAQEAAQQASEAAAARVPAVYSVPTAYVAPPVTYYYATPVRYYYVVPRPPQIVRWVYPPAVRRQSVPMYRYAPVGGPGYRQQGRFGH